MSVVLIHSLRKLNNISHELGIRPVFLAILCTASMLLATFAIPTAVNAATNQKSTPATEQHENALPGSGVTVRQAYNVSFPALYWGEIVRIGLEELGYEVAPAILLQVPASHIAVAQGQIDYIATEYSPLQDSYYEKVKDRASRIGTLITGAKQGYLIDKKTAERYNIRYFPESFRDPEIAKIFDTNNNGKANLAGCEPGWGCAKIIEYQLDKWDLNSTVEQDQASYNPMFSDVLARFRAGKPVLYYTWTPNFTTAVLQPGKDVVWLEARHCTTPSGECGDSNTGWSQSDIHIMANNEFLASNPAARKFFELVKIPLADANAEYLKDHEHSLRNEEQVYEDAKMWVKAHKNEFEEWIRRAREAANRPQR